MVPNAVGDTSAPAPMAPEEEIPMQLTLSTQEFFKKRTVPNVAIFFGLLLLASS